MLRSTLLKLETRLTPYVFCKNLPLKRDTGVVSFCFDDTSLSSCVAGRNALEAFGCHGTWYIAGGLTDQLEQGRLCHSVRDVQDLAGAGHHIGCHTFSHKSCAQMSTTELLAEIDSNAAFFEQIGLPSSNLDFSFPFGAMDLSSKRIASQKFRSSRITGGGIQVGTADLNRLRTQNLYQQAITQERIDALTAEVANKKGWLIFYTHDVEENPSRWGCTPKLLSGAIQSALNIGCKVMSVAQAIEYWSEPLKSVGY